MATEPNLASLILSEVYSRHEMITLINIQGSYESLCQEGNVVIAIACILPLAVEV